MSLIAWYPLHRDINDWSGNNNHLNYIRDAGNLSTSQYGKIGSAWQRTVNNTTDLLRSTNKINLNGDFTMAAWIKPTGGYHSGTANGLVTNHDHTTNNGPGLTLKHFSSTDVRLSCNTGSGTGRTYHSYFGDTNIHDKWVHCVMRYKDGIVTLWVDGVIDYTFGYSMVCKDDYLDLFNWSTSYDESSNYRPKAILNDVRIYDHALSTNEIQELSLATVAKWNMNGANEFLPRNSTRNPNFIPGAAYVNGTWDTELNKDAILCESWSSGYNGGVPDPEIGYHAKWVNIDGKAVMRQINDNQRFGYGDRWMGISGGHGNLVDYGLEVGDKITVSWTQRSTHTGATFNVGFYTRRADGSTKWESGKTTHMQNVAGEWERKSYTTTVGSDTDVNRSITIYFYGHYSVEGATMEAKDIQFECYRDVANPYRKFSADDVIVSDMTGLENNALLEYDYAPSYVENDTERGSGHFHFPSSGRTGWNDIRRHIRTSANHMSRQVSVAFWARTTQGDNRNPFMKYDDGIYTEGSQGSGGAILLCLEGNRFRMHGWGSSDPICQTHTNDGEWHHYVWTFDYDTRLANMFVDGVREIANSLDSEGVIQPLENYVWTIGANMHPYSSTTGATFNGDITEVSIHGKALSVDEVSRMYNVKASVDNLGNAHAVEFQEGWDHDGENTLMIRSSSSGNTGTYLNGVKTGYQSSSRGIGFCIFDQAMTLRAFGSLDTYSGTTAQYYEFDGEVIVASANDVPDSAQAAANHLKDAIDRMEDGWLMTAARCDASTTQDGTLREYFERYFGVTENHAIVSRGTWGFIGIKNGELLTQFSDGRRYDASSGSITYYTKEYAATGDFHKPQVTKDGVMHAGEIVESYYRPGLLDYSTWTLETTGSQPGFNVYGSNAIIAVAKNPWGEDDVMWRGYKEDSTTQSGGFYAHDVNMNPAKHHRFTLWMRRSVSGNGNWYVGCNGSMTNNLSGSANTNPYFDYGTNYFDNEWVLLVAYVYANGTTDNDTYTDHGIYDVDGNRLSSINTNYAMGDGATENYMRAFMYKSSATDTEQFFYRPRIDVMDGSQPTLDELLSGSESMPLLPSYGEDVDYNGNVSFGANGDAMFNEFNEV